MSTNSRLEADSLAHAESMDRIYGVQRHFYDATRAYYLLGRDRMLDQLDLAPGETALEIGCGTGRNLIGAARRYPQAKFFGFDISSEMLRSAERSTAGANNITLALGDATQFNATTMFGQAQFDRLYFSYTLSMIPDWQAALTQAFAAVKPGGALHVVDFGDCAHLPGWFKRGLYSWLAQFHVTPRLALEDALKHLGRAEIARPYRSYALIAKVVKT
ncbi:class I SAM-dependent methyltransferase [Aestuariivirga litoralis]|uniref:class I SAM-dependent methyltransferase n=1 Tax=Aestuariivirga litoralis TaxID=2650924 RepID=UPI0018C582E0|nr:class I SAM-dependent methyltransferase [Aestuariivirga litoralis]MBG1232615.1 class I SAM-dependent methyltransferase [Aestuariivirga litoralis]